MTRISGINPGILLKTPSKYYSNNDEVYRPAQ